ncbi:MAG: pantoate--beta-alanine ligase [Chloroflexota bacterium]|nr:pantoate--beta-alanine ligase [Chloroflexota bacterium]
MQQIDTPDALIAARKTMTGKVGLVPTMGALHAGHLALVEAARRENDHVIVTIFVNPAQFGVGEDLTTYPRPLMEDLAHLRALDVDVVFTPTASGIYPPRYQTHLDVEILSMGLEGAARPGHFRGVATVVAKLFNLAQPTTAYFGQKDAQQILVIRQMIRDLHMPVEIAICPTVREADGLAMSSRNRNLAPNERQAANVLFRSLFAAAEAYDSGERQPVAFRETALHVLRSEPMAQVDYVAICNPRTLFGVHDAIHDPALMLLAVKIGAVRLLDNALLPWSSNERAGLLANLGASL